MTQPVVLIWTHHTLTREVDYSNAVLTSTYEIKLLIFFKYVFSCLHAIIHI